MATIKMHISKVKSLFYPPCEVKYMLQNGVSTALTLEYSTQNNNNNNNNNNNIIIIIIK